MCQKTNIILILTDHFRRTAIGKSTPNLNKLAEEGTTFTNAYCASPLCQPARTSLITGMPIWKTGICGNQSNPLTDELRDDTFMNRLQKEGYYTALIGKHHYIDRYGIGMDVTGDNAEIKKYGFDYVFQVVDDGENMHNEDEYTHYLREKGMLEEFRRVYKTNAGCCKPHPFSADDTADGFIGKNGIKFIRNYDQDKPLYLNLSFIGPHPPYWHPGDLKHKPGEMSAPISAADRPETREKRAHYMDKCALIDSYIGKLVETLKEKGMYDTTTILFTSDHGDCLGDFDIWDKRYFYEQSVGVPFIMSGAGIASEERQNGAKISKALVSHFDLYPTILGLAGIKNNVTKKRPGLDIMAMLKEERGAFRNEIFAELATAVMIRTCNWKLVFDPQQGGTGYLFNLAVDPGEECNLAGTAGYEKITSELVQRILSYRILNSQFTHIKEEQRLQTVHAGM